MGVQQIQKGSDSIPSTFDGGNKKLRREVTVSPQPLIEVQRIQEGSDSIPLNLWWGGGEILREIK